MSKYLELVEGSFTQEHFDRQTNQNPYVAYSIQDNKVVYTIIPKEEENEIDPTEGFVGLGLSVMWASCNLGAGNPEELGEMYRWGETDEHKNGEEEYTESPNLSEYSYSYDRDAVTVSMKDNPYTKYLHYRIPTAELWQELIDNTTREVYTNSDGRNICKYTSNINGNFILLPLLTQVEGNENIYYKTTTPSSLVGKEQSISNAGKIIRIYSESGATSVVSDFYDANSYQNNYVRGVCSYPPKTDIIQYGNSISSDSTFVLTSAHSIKITCPEDFTVYFSNTPDFALDPSNENVVGYYTAQKNGDNYDRQISCKELEFGQSKHDYLYLRFVCNQSSQLNLSLWNVSYCLANTILITSGQTLSIPASDNIVYRMNYNDWVDYDFTINWTGRNTLSVYVASYCDFYSTDPEVLKVLTVSSRGSLVVSKDMLTTWGVSLESDGFLYIRLKSERQGNATFTSAKPADI